MMLISNSLNKHKQAIATFSLSLTSLPLTSDSTLGHIPQNKTLVIRFFTGQILFLLPNLQCQSTGDANQENNKRVSLQQSTFMLFHTQTDSWRKQYCTLYLGIPYIHIHYKYKYSSMNTSHARLRNIPACHMLHRYSELLKQSSVIINYHNGKSAYGMPMILYQPSKSSARLLTKQLCLYKWWKLFTTVECLVK